MTDAVLYSDEIRQSQDSSVAADRELKVVCCNHRLPVSTMTPNSRGGNGTTPTLNVVIDALDISKDLSRIAPAQAAFGSVSSLLTTTRVRSNLPAVGGCVENVFFLLLADVSLGLDGQRSGIRRTRAKLCRYL